MNTTPTWPDRMTYSAVVQRPEQHFKDPDLKAATFLRSRRGQVLAWSGGRAIVFHAVCPGGSHAAVRFMLSNDREAGVRYGALSRHLSANPIEMFVRTEWVAGGLHVGEQQYPVVKMDWVEGQALDRYISSIIDSPSAASQLTALARSWQQCCRALAEARVGHGDIHAGNLLVGRNDGNVCELRLVDYDNVWVPGLQAPSREAGHPSFQHPARLPGTAGPYMDAFPNTLMLLSLRALACEPALWQFHDGDDMLLIQRQDLEDPGREVWSALGSCSDPLVRSMTELTTGWLSGSPDQYRNLDQLLEAANLTTAREPHVLNVWPPPAAVLGDANAPGRWPTPASPGPARPATPGHDGAATQTWPGTAASARRPTGPPSQQWPISPAAPPAQGWSAQPVSGSGNRAVAVGLVLTLCLLGLLLIVVLSLVR
ncbi:MAG: hypothetical protein QOK10_87 [Pseudonocardiales bacterium]|jgi:hypothetical protein|nr:hypothetical protein [Pseudonocardiales bacterium]